MDDAMRAFACQSITKAMEKINEKEKKLGFKVTSVERSEYSKPDLYIWAELQSGNHVVKRRFALELLDY